MEQKITLKIAGSTYSFKVNSPEQEQIMRKAAEVINEEIAYYDRKYPERTLADKLSIVSLHEAMSRLAIGDKMKLLDEEAAQLHNQTEKYLEDIENK
jgi:cell division protein ZapA